MGNTANGNVDPKAVSELLLTKLRRLDREPFQQELATALANGPGPEAYKALATSDPEKWSRAVFALARLGGFTNQSETLHRHVTQSKDEMLVIVYQRFGEAAAVKAGLELGYSKERTLSLLQNLPALIEATEDDYESETDDETDSSDT